MVTFISRTVGVFVILGLAAIGADAVLQHVLAWKDSYDRHNQLV